MQLVDIETAFLPGQITFETFNLSPRETGLDFGVFVSPRMGSHTACIKVTLPPWGSKPEAVYTIAPFGLAAGEAWLSKTQEDRLRLWVAANRPALLGYWDGDILYDQDFAPCWCRSAPGDNGSSLPTHRRLPPTPAIRPAHG